MKVGETRHEKTFFGAPIDRTYDNNGQKVSETKHEESLLSELTGGVLGEDRSVTYVDGKRVSKTVHEEGIFGKKNLIYQDGEKIGILKTERQIFCGRKEILHEVDEDVDLTKRVSREKHTQTSRSYFDYDCEGQTGVLQRERQGESRRKNLEKVSRENVGRHYYAYSYTSPKAIKRALDTGLYIGVRFVPDTYLVTYRCDRCGHEWQATIPETYLRAKEFDDCRMGCSKGADNSSLLGLYKIIKGLITGKKPFGYGRLIKKENLTASSRP